MTEPEMMPANDLAFRKALAEAVSRANDEGVPLPNILANMSELAARLINGVGGNFNDRRAGCAVFMHDMMETISELEKVHGEGAHDPETCPDCSPKRTVQ